MEQSIYRNRLQFGINNSTQPGIRPLIGHNNIFLQSLLVYRQVCEKYRRKKGFFVLSA